jgi:hypothetical protein
MTAVIVFLPAVLGGMLLVHILWPDRHIFSLVLKAFLGIGVGLGLSSLLYFAYLLILPARHAFIFIDLAALVILVGVAVIAERRRRAAPGPSVSPAGLTRTQRLLLLLSGVVFVISLLSTANYLLRRRQGDWDAWMMYNRAARFVYLDQAHWLKSFSPQMDPIFHPDYPLLLAMNIASGWELVGRDSPSVPMFQSGLFAVACLGLLAGALASVKSIGQAAVGVIILWGLPVFVNEGARQMADVPMAFYILATGALCYLYVVRRNPGLMILAGFTAGLAAWTKNEGSVLVIGTAAAVILWLAPRHRGALLRFAAGLALPLAALFFFKIFLAPSGDMLNAVTGGSTRQLLDASRHLLILRYFFDELRGFGGWRIGGVTLGILPVLILYYLLFRRPVPASSRPAYIACLAILVIQILGYYAAYLVSPYDLAWHLSYSSTRIALQIFPLLLFVTLCASLDVETVFSPAAKEVQHASDH